MRLKIKQNKIIGFNSSIKVTPAADLVFDKWLKRTINVLAIEEKVSATPVVTKSTTKKTVSKKAPAKKAPVKKVASKKTVKAKKTRISATDKIKNAAFVASTSLPRRKAKAKQPKTSVASNSDNKVEFVGITKKFGTNVANDNVSFGVRENEVHALLGENGAGKSTLMSILFGLYKPTSGHIEINGQIQKIKDPRHANELKIAMLPQHFKLVDNMSVVDNVILGYEKINKEKGKAIDILESIARKFKLKIDLKAKIQDLSISDKQKVEILKILWRDADVIIFDEPTSILTPQEIDNFLKLIKFLQKQGKTILIITHKLPEIKAVANRVSVIRKGKYISTHNVADVSEKEMAELMVGAAVNLNLASIERIDIDPKAPKALVVNGLTYKGTEYEQSLNNVSFDIKKGEIVGIAAIDGNGQSELVKSIAGLHKVKGQVIVDGSDITDHSVRNRYADRTLSKQAKNSRAAYDAGLENFNDQLFNAQFAVQDYREDKNISLKQVGKTLNDILNKPVTAISHIPEDRHKFGLILDYSVRKNSVLQDIDRFSSKFGFLRNRDIDSRLNYIKARYDVRGIVTPLVKARSLSGGNQQKLIIGREIERAPKLLLAAHPTRGLDVGAIRNVYESIVDARNKGMAVLLQSGELDEIMQVSDRIIVMRDGKIVSTSKRGELSKTKLGSLMSGGK